MVSVLMSVYNAEMTVARAIESILSQTYYPLELILCDDASTDNSWEIMKAYADKDKRIHLIQNESNMGLGASLNRCLEISNGEFIARQDADDYSAPERLEESIQYLVQSNLPYMASGLYVFDENGVWSERKYPESITRHMIAQKNPFFHPTMVFRRKIIMDVGGYRVADITRRTEDYDLVMRLAAQGIIGKNMQKSMYFCYEPPEAYLKHTYRTRLAEMKVRLYGLRVMKAPPWDYIYTIKPAMMLLIPKSLMRKIKERQWR